MGLGRDTSPKTYLKLNTKEEKPVFKVYEKDANTGKYAHTQNEQTVSGYFKSIKFMDNEYEGTVSKRMALTISDNGMDYVIDSSLSQTCRSIINTLCSYAELGFVEIRLATRTYNSKIYPAVYLSVNGDDKPKWKLSIDEQKELTHVTEKRNGTKDYDFFDLNNKLMELAASLKPAEANELNSAASAMNKAGEELDSYMKAANTPAQITPEEEDDLPF